MAAQACFLAVVSLICLHSVSGRSTDTLSPRSSAKEHPRTLDQVLMQANGQLAKGRRLGDDKISDGLDMVLTKRQYSMLYGGSQGRSQGDDDKLVETWPNGVVPYIIQYGSFTPERISKIEEGMATWQALTCVSFRPAASSDTNYVDIGSGDGCWSELGKNKNPQPQLLSLNYNGCFHQGTVEHELGHAIGLVHEHQRPERDYHLGVYENNVIPFFRTQVQVYSEHAVDKLGLPYDYYSIMHYGKTAFSFDGVSLTMFAYDRRRQKHLPKVTEELGKVIGPSFIDVKLVNLMYNCSASCHPMPACSADCFVDKHCRCVCKEDMPAVPCANYEAQCESWARQGECLTNRPYTEYFCRKACKMCPEHGTLPPEEPHMPCEDKRTDCQALADIGDCDTMRETMMIDCWKTCSGCKDTGTATDTPGEISTTAGTSEPQTAKPCEDKRPDCQVLADRGDCDSTREAMMNACWKTCTGCKNTGTANGGTSACVDDNENCAAWAEANYCNYYPHIVPTCKKSCGACS